MRCDCASVKGCGLMRCDCTSVKGCWMWADEV